MKTVTYEEFLELNPGWVRADIQVNQLNQHFEANPNMSAMDILGWGETCIEDRFWAVLREELIPEEILHEFTCLCAERALSLVDNPDPRSVEAITAKRKWMKGEISDEELKLARDAASSADCMSWVAWKTARMASMAAWVAMSGEQEWQLNTLVKLIEGKRKK